VILRENTEGLFASYQHGLLLRDQVATDTITMTRSGVERIMRYAFRLARKRNGAPEDGKRRVTCVDKSNALRSMAFFRKIFEEVAREFPDIEAEGQYIDAMTMYMVRRPSHFDVVVTENQFGDIISDLGPGTVGSMAISPSGDIGDSYGLFEPAHGSAPDIAGKGIANPIGQILSARMMLDWLGERNQDTQAQAAARAIELAVEKTLADPRYLTKDLGGKARTAAVGDAVAKAVSAGA
jgi:3-isopropylmalate dehydrogenase